MMQTIRYFLAVLRHRYLPDCARRGTLGHLRLRAGDGQTLDTANIQSAIDRASDGSGTVVVPKGIYLSASSLKPGVNLHLDKDASLEGSTASATIPSR
jgi:hypothetical protein